MVVKENKKARMCVCVMVQKVEKVYGFLVSEN